MSIVKSVKGGIKSARYLKAAIEYVTNPENNNNQTLALSDNDDKGNHLNNLVSYASKKEKAVHVTAVNCDLDNAIKQFEITRKTWKKDNGIIAHHFVQSFSPEENITPEQVHKLGLELANKAFKDYQVIVATHIDRNHLHNHIIVNSCNVVNGSKWHGNKKTLNAVRYVNDSISEEYGFSIIPETTGITSSTMYGKNINDPIRKKVAKDILDCLENTSTKDEFTAALLEKGYTVRYGKQITFRIANSAGKKNSSFRGDTLARKYGMMFSTKAIYKKYDIKINTHVNAHNAVNNKDAQEFLENKKKKLCGLVFNNNDESSTLQALKKFNISASENDDFLFTHYYKVIEIDGELNKLKYTKNDVKKITLYLYLQAELFRIRLKKNFKFFYKRSSYKNPKPVYFRTTDRVSTRYYGNIRLRELLNMPGDNVSVKIDAEKVTRFINAPFFYYVSLKDDGTANILFKKSDRSLAEKILGKSIPLFDPKDLKEDDNDNDNINESGAEKQNRIIERNKNYNKIKTWKDNNVPLKYKNNLTAFQVSQLRSAGVILAEMKRKKKATEKHNTASESSETETNGMNICYPESYERKVYEILYPNLNPVNCNVSRNTLDKMAIENDFEKSFKVITLEQYDKLVHSDVEIPSTVYLKKDKSAYNLLYFSKDEEALRKVILSEYDLKLNYRPYRNWKKNNVPLKWLDDISAAQVDALNFANARIAVFNSKTNPDNYRIAFPIYEENSVMNVIDPNINLNNASFSYKEFGEFLRENDLKSRTLEINADQLAAFKHVTLKNYPSCVYKTKTGQLKLMCLDSDYAEIANIISVELPRSERLMNEWKLKGIELRWKKDLTQEQIEALKKIKCDYAAFQKKNGTVTIAYPAYSEREIFVTIYPNRNPVTCNVPYKNLKKYAQNNGKRLRSMYVTSKQYEYLISGKEEIMSCAFKCNDKDGYNVIHLANDNLALQQLLKRAVSKFSKLDFENGNIVYQTSLSRNQINRLMARKADIAIIDESTIAYDVKNQVYIRSVISEDYALKLKANKIKLGLKPNLSEGEAERLLDSEVECTLQYNPTSQRYTAICDYNDKDKVREELDDYNDQQSVLQI